MSNDETAAKVRIARGADRLYGDLLIVLAVASLAAPLFAAATLAWALVLAGLAGVWWLFLDRTVHGMCAAAGWTLVTLALGLHLAFHIGLDIVPLDLTLCVGFLLLGGAELLLALARYGHRRGARLILIIGAASAAAFGLAVPFYLPAMPDWAPGVTLALMFAGVGVALLLGSRGDKSGADAG